MKKTNKGFGTNFHRVYKEDAELYHAFSGAEVFSPELEKKINDLLIGKTLLDVACGTCHKTNAYSKYFEKVFALDFSHLLLDSARNRYSNNKKLNFIWSSAAKIPLLDESVDTILVTWGSFPLTKGIMEMQRVLKKGGRIIRIGACKEDEFTTLFPLFSSKRITTINNTFEKFGFMVEQQKVAIEFKSIKEARDILSRITGVSEKRINQSKFEHAVALCYYTKK